MRGQTRARQATTRVRQRGAGFPRLSLATVADLLGEAARSYGPVFSREAFAALGARRRDARGSTRSGTYLAKLAAFKDFGLIVVEGRQIRLTDLAQRIALPTSALSRQEALQTAFRQAAVFQRLYADSPKGEAIAVETIADRAIWHYGVAVAGRHVFARAFVDSAAAAGLLERLDPSTVRPLAEPGAPPTASPPGGPAPISASLAARAPETPPDLSPSAAAKEPAPKAEPPPVVQQRWVGAGYVVGFEIRAERPLRPALFRQVADIVADLERLATEIGCEHRPDAD